MTVAGRIDSRNIFGAEVQYFRLDPRYWEPVLRRLKDAGLRCVTTYVQWGTHAVAPPDPGHPAGVLDFAGRTDPRRNLLGFLDLVERLGLDLNFRCGPFCCNEMVHGGYPPWIVMGDPGMLVWDHRDKPAPGYWVGKKEGGQPSYLHPEYLEWCRKWLAEVDPIIAAHLKSRGGCVTLINLDNEVSYIVQDGFLSSDYNPVNVRPGGLYHRFLAQKYGSASGLPYPAGYAAIEDVPAPRSVPDAIGDDVAYYVDWCEFKTWAMAGYIQALRRMHEAGGAGGATFMTNLNPHRPEGVPARMPEFEKAAGGIVGYDFYRGSFLSYSGYLSMARVLKLMNASCRYTYSAEFMSGIWNKVLPSRVSDDHMRFMARCALAHGCKALAWFMFHDRDCWGDAPVSSHGHARPSLAVLAETVGLAFGAVRDWDALRPQADAAVVYDLIHHRHTCVGDPSPCDDNNLYIGKPSIDGVEAGLASREYEGLFPLIEQAGVQAAVVDVMHDAGPLGAYPLAFLPGSPVMESLASRRLGEYVERGGVLALCGPWPGRSERGQALKFLGLDEPSSPGGAVEIAIGRGRLIWHREWLAQGKPEEEDPASAAFVSSLIEKHVTRPHVRIRPAAEVSWVDWQEGGGHRLYRQPRCLGSAILQRGTDETILFVLNHYPEAACFEVEFPRDRVRRLVNLVTGEKTDVAGGRAVLDIDRKSGEVYRVE
jgi:beta-galactosidase